MIDIIMCNIFVSYIRFLCVYIRYLVEDICYILCVEQ